MPQRRVRHARLRLPEHHARRTQTMPRKKIKELPPLFYCDNCGAEVSRDETFCPKCGRKFASIRCPACGFFGEENLFYDGCPQCGYQVLSGKGGHRRPAFRHSHGKTSFASASEGELPVWVYFVTFAFFIFALSFLLFYMSR
jgi:Zn finger protein HypA/HybF involved in hydrogenase expression